MVVTLKNLPIATQLGIKALLESGYSVNKVAKMAKVCEMTVRAVKKLETLDLDRVTRIKKNLGNKFYATADRALDHVTDTKLKDASAPQLMMTAGIALDKARLIEGKATSRVEFQDADDKDLEAEIAALEAQIKGEAIPTELVEEGDDDTANSGVELSAGIEDKDSGNDASIEAGDSDTKEGEETHLNAVDGPSINQPNLDVEKDA